VWRPVQATALVVDGGPKRPTASISAMAGGGVYGVGVGAAPDRAGAGRVSPPVRGRPRSGVGALRRRGRGRLRSPKTFHHRGEPAAGDEQVGGRAGGPTPGSTQWKDVAAVRRSNEDSGTSTASKVPTSTVSRRPACLGPEALSQALVELHGRDRRSQLQQAAGGLARPRANLEKAGAGAETTVLHQQVVDPLWIGRAAGVIVVDRPSETAPGDRSDPRDLPDGEGLDEVAALQVLEVLQADAALEAGLDPRGRLP